MCEGERGKDRREGWGRGGRVCACVCVCVCVCVYELPRSENGVCTCDLSQGLDLVLGLT